MFDPGYIEQNAPYGAIGRAHQASKRPLRYNIFLGEQDSENKEMT